MDTNKLENGLLKLLVYVQRYGNKKTIKIICNVYITFNIRYIATMI